MDLSGLKWPLIIAAVAGLGWLATSGGINYMVGNFSEAQPGEDAERDKLDEAGLSRVGGYLLHLWNWKKAKKVMKLSIDRYGPQGANYWYNWYRVARCNDRMKLYQESYNVLKMLIEKDGPAKDSRMARLGILKARAAKLKEIHELK